MRLVGSAVEETEVMPLSPGALEQKLEDVAKADRDGHVRNHERFDDLNDRLKLVESILAEHGKRILDHDRRVTDATSRITGQDRRRTADLIEQKDRKIEATQVRFTTQQVVMIAVACAGIITGPWLFNWGLRADVASILQEQVSQQKMVSRIQEQQTKDIDELKKDNKLYGIQINNLRQDFINLQQSKARK